MYSLLCSITTLAGKPLNTRFSYHPLFYAGLGNGDASHGVAVNETDWLPSTSYLRNDILLGEIIDLCTDMRLATMHLLPPDWRAVCDLILPVALGLEHLAFRLTCYL